MSSLARYVLTFSLAPRAPSPACREVLVDDALVSGAADVLADDAVPDYGPQSGLHVVGFHVHPLVHQCRSLEVAVAEKLRLVLAKDVPCDGA
jgi:hypothetical protein